MSFIKITEQNSLYNDLERKSVRDLLEDINTEDQKVASVEIPAPVSPSSGHPKLPYISK